MRLGFTASAYLVRQVLGWGAIGLVSITLVFLSHSLVQLLERLLLIGIAGNGLATILKCVVLSLFAYTVPIAFVFGVMVAIGRMAADSEVLALRACGLGLREILLPITALALLIAVLTGWLLLDVEPRSRRELRETLVAMTTHASMIEPHEFKRVGDRVVYVQSRDEDDRLAGILISDRSDPQRPLTIFAEAGVFRWDALRGEARFRLRNGDIHLEPASEDAAEYRRIAFDEIEYAFAVKSLVELAAAHLRPKDMTTQELRARLARHAAAGRGAEGLRPRELRVQLQRRYALPAAPVLFALVGVPLAMRRTRGGRSWGVLLCVALIGAYYGALTASQYLALEGLLPAEIALWLPNALCAGAAALLLFQARRAGR
jgi:lipopolysaccharide export system permease protein